MSSAALALTAASRPAVNPWFVAAAVVVPTFMEILDTTIANVALRYIAGGLSATNDDSDWVMTSYLAANATILPITGWLSAHLGRRNYFLLSIAVFTIASGLCGMATSLGQLILFRVIQGIAGGGLQPASQGILLDSFPPEKQGTAKTMFGVAALLAPVIGPTLGGYITVNYNWRWIFLINLPVGAIGFLLCLLPGRRPRIPQEAAGRAASAAAQLRLHRPGAARPDDVVLGSDAQQGAGVGLVQRPLLAGADALRRVRPRAGQPGLPGDEDRQPGGQLPAAGRAELRGLLHHHLLCLRRALRSQHVPAVPAPVPVRLRRLRLGAGAVALGRFLHHGIVRRRRSHRSGRRCPLADRRGALDHGGRELLDGAR